MIPLSTSQRVPKIETGSASVVVGAIQDGPRVSTDAILERVRQRVAEKVSKAGPAAVPQSLDSPGSKQFEPLECYPWRRALGSRDPIHIKELVKAPKGALAERLYRIVLCRKPGELEVRATEKSLADGVHPVAVTARLRWSKEGRAVGIVVFGLIGRIVPAVVLSVARRISTLLGN